MSVADAGGGAGTDGGSPERRSTPTVLLAVARRLRTDPTLCLPFGLAGLVVGLADWLRLRDPLPVGQPAWVGDTFSVQYGVFPSGTARTSRQLGAFMDLQLPYLLGGLALEAVVALAVGVAGWLTITRALSADRTAGSFGRYVGVLALTVAGIRPVSQVEVGSLPLALLAIAVVVLFVVRLFLVPGLLATGSGFRTALRESVRRSRGVRVTLGWLAVLLGVASWGLATVPVVGGFLSTAVVGTVQAVAIAVVLGWQSDEWVSTGGHGSAGSA